MKAQNTLPKFVEVWCLAVLEMDNSVLGVPEDRLRVEKRHQSRFASKNVVLTL